MDAETLFWTKWAAIGQMLGAAGTFAAVFASLYIAFRSRRPSLKISAGVRVFIGPGLPSDRFLMFEVANAGDRPVQISGIGWCTGYLRRGPSWLKLRYAVQVAAGNSPWGATPPFELQPGKIERSGGPMAVFIDHARMQANDPFFTRDWPIIGRRGTRARVYVDTADGFRFFAKPEQNLLVEAIDAEKIGSQPR